MTVLTVVSAGLRDPSSTRLLADRIAVAAERELAGTVHDTPAAAPVEGAAPAVEPVEVRHVEVRRHAHAIADALLTGFPSGELAQALADVADESMVAAAEAAHVQANAWCFIANSVNFPVRHEAVVVAV